MEGLPLFVEETLQVEHAPHMLDAQLFAREKMNPDQEDTSPGRVVFSATGQT